MGAGNAGSVVSCTQRSAPGNHSRILRPHASRTRYGANHHLRFNEPLLNFNKPMTNKRLASALFISLAQVVACGSNTDGGAGGSSAGGASSAGATTVAGASAGGASAGTSSTAGTSSGGSSAGGSSAGGSSAGASSAAGSSGGAVAGGSSGEAPAGAVSTCLGAGCPYGACNDSSTTTCASVYPGEIGPTAPLCKADGDYCLGTGAPSAFKSWSVHCTGTTATTVRCTGNCSYSYIDKTAACPGM